jgi:hypothetical protein
VTLHRDKDKDGMLTLRTAKTGTDVRVPLPPAAIKALNAIPTSEYFFWSGNGLVKSAVGNYGRAMRTLYKLAGVKNGHAHRWRDTFATELLLKGATIGQVAALLGHQSTKVTEKHYSPWVKARQEQLEAVVRRRFSLPLRRQSAAAKPVCLPQFCYSLVQTSLLEPQYLRFSGGPGGARTPNPLLRRQMLYPVELRARRKVYHEVRQLRFCSTGIPACAAGRAVKIVDLARPP